MELESIKRTRESECVFSNRPIGTHPTEERRLPTSPSAEALRELTAFSDEITTLLLEPRIGLALSIKKSGFRTYRNSNKFVITSNVCARKRGNAENSVLLPKKSCTSRCRAYGTMCSVMSARDVHWKSRVEKISPSAAIAPMRICPSAHGEQAVEMRPSPQLPGTNKHSGTSLHRRLRRPYRISLPRCGAPIASHREEKAKKTASLRASSADAVLDGVVCSPASSSAAALW